MTRMTGPDCVVMCNLINTHTHKLDNGKYKRNSKFGHVFVVWSPHPLSADGEINVHLLAPLGK